MKKIFDLFGLYAEFSKTTQLLLGALPFLLLIAAYLIVSDIRLRNNPSEKITPSVRQMASATKMMAFTKDNRTEEYLMWTDTLATLKRLALGLGLSAAVGLFVGLNTGLVPIARTTFFPFVTFASMIPPLAMLPILFITCGAGDFGKVVLIFFGTVLTIIKDVQLRAEQIPRQQIAKGLTLGASQFSVVYRIVLPQIMPQLLHSVRLQIITAWLFLIASEALGATSGLGYRIFLVRRYLSMDIIIPYVLWIVVLGCTLDVMIRLTVRWFYPWYAYQGST